MIWLRRVRLMLVLVTLGHAGSARAEEQPTLSGRWAASALMTAWNFGDWGDACGPRPTGSGAPAGTVTIEQQGSELHFSGAGRGYSTTECWEQYEGLVRVSHTGGKRGWRTTCRTKPGDPRQATVVTTVTASDSYITLDETGQYQFVVKGQNCTASARRSRSFRLLQREGEAPPRDAAAPAPAASAPVPVPAQIGRCAEPGPPSRLEVRPARKLMRPGESFTFRAVVLDDSGCKVSMSPNFRLGDRTALLQVTPFGNVKVLDDAKEGAIPLVASAGGRSVSVLVEVVSNARYAALLESEGLTPEGESKEAAVASIATTSIGTRMAVAEDRARSRRTRFIGVVGAAALVLGVVGLILVVRSRKQREPAGEQASPVPRASRSIAPGARSLGSFCPTCREEYAAGAQYCPLDGNRLLPLDSEADGRGPAGGVCPVCGQGFDPGVTSCPKHDEELVPIGVYRARLAQAMESAKVCPVCGTQYPADGRFCGRDGAALVPMN